ncbi:hypothetical protein AcW1_005543 [Taiwanofungus camphoratus]|nr:hypothetical protein AcV5_005865 [Antrodia cinnamomea]KAI0957015.1 hypothetical protein AcW1_005543 [Antrodia cinnamomea]
MSEATKCPSGLRPMATFDMVVLGCGGGPNEHNLSCYLFKLRNASWNDGIFALEAGSGIGALSRLLHRQPDLFGHRPVDDDRNPQCSAVEIYSWIRCFLITHSHLDHVNSLVLSAGSLSGSSRHVFGASRTLKDLEGIFSDRIWPKLASWNEDDSLPLIFSPLSPDRQYKSISRGVSVRMMPINHGQNDTIGLYESSAFFIRHDLTACEFLFFGDVEPDSIAAKPLNLNVWRVAAPKIPQNLSTIFIECSFPSGRKDDMLFGHLSPEHLAVELTALAAEVVDYKRHAADAESQGRDGSTRARKKQRRDQVSSFRGALNGVRVYIIHCKDDIHGHYDRPINHVIADEVRALVDAQELGVQIIAVDQGMQIAI